MMTLAGVGAVFAALCLAPSASAACSTIIYDYVPGLDGIACYGSDSDTWVMPAGITKPRFMLRGADDAVGGQGGFVEAKLPAVPGAPLDLRVGGSGEASSVSLGGEALLVAGGGNGKVPNYVSPEAEALEVEEPGAPVGKYVGGGSIYVEWYEAREPFELAEPLPYTIVDIFDSEKDGFGFTGSWQEWTVPSYVDHVLFELFGGAGESGEPRGHILAGAEVEPGQTFGIEVGGYGEDTSLFFLDESFRVGVAAGGDTERPNYLPWMASPGEEFWEGGGPESKPSTGYAIVHYWPEGPPEPPDEELPDTEHKVEEQSPSVDENPPVLGVRRSLDPAPPCIVPRLRGRTLRSTRPLSANVT